VALAPVARGPWPAGPPNSHSQPLDPGRGSRGTPLTLILTKVSADAATEFAGFLTVFNDLIGGRYGLRF